MLIVHCKCNKNVLRTEGRYALRRRNVLITLKLNRINETLTKSQNTDEKAELAYI